ncbi:MAG: ABC transporter permease [Patescibacteria group bacterium]
MDFFEFINLALNSLRTNKVRSILTMLGIIIGVGSVILLVSIGTGLQNFVTQQFAALGSNTLYVMPGKLDLSQGPRSSVLSKSKFDLGDSADLARGSDTIKQSTPVIQGFGQLKYNGNTSSTEVWGVWESFFDISNFKARDGKIVTQNDVERSRRIVVFGSKPAKDLFGENSNVIGKQITLNGVRFEIAGILESKGGGGGLGSADDFVAIPLTVAQRQFDENRPTMLLAQAIDQESVVLAVRDAKRILSKRLKEDDFSVIEQTQLLDTISSFLGVVTAALGGIASISLLVGGIGIMNIMLVSVTERTREIGLRKAVGATPSAILIQFLIEAIILSLVGGGIGIGLGALGSMLLNNFIQTSVTWWSVALAFGFSALVGIIFGVAPAIRAARLDPIEALRYE